jgi:DNA-binding NtrC family response regulator
MRQTKVTPQGKPPVRIRTRAVIACTDPRIRQVLISVLREFGLQPVFLDEMGELRTLLAQQETVIVFIQSRFVKNGFREVLSAAERPGSRIPVIVCSEFYDRDIYMEAMTQGAFDYLATPYRREEVAWVVNNAVNWGSPARAHA